MKLDLVDQSEAIRQMGRDDYRAGFKRDQVKAFFGEKSQAWKHWVEGWDEEAAKNDCEEVTDDL